MHCHERTHKHEHTLHSTQTHAHTYMIKNTVCVLDLLCAYFHEERFNTSNVSTCFMLQKIVGFLQPVKTMLFSMLIPFDSFNAVRTIVHSTLTSKAICGFNSIVFI